MSEEKTAHIFVNLAVGLNYSKTRAHHKCGLIIFLNIKQCVVLVNNNQNNRGGFGRSRAKGIATLIATATMIIA
jgi:hypothetical protein